MSHYWCQRPVVIEEHRQSLPLRDRHSLHGVRELVDIGGGGQQLTEVGDHEIGPLGLELSGLTGPVHPDDEGEAPATAGLYTGECVFHDRGPARIHTEAPCCLEEDVGHRFPGEAQLV